MSTTQYYGYHREFVFSGFGFTFWIHTEMLEEMLKFSSYNERKGVFWQVKFSRVLIICFQRLTIKMMLKATRAPNCH